MTQSSTDALKDYNKVLSLLNSNKSDAYEELIKMESNVLNVANRVAESKLKENVDDTNIYNQSIPRLIHQTVNTWIMIFRDLTSIDVISYTEISNILFKGERKIFVGILLAVVAAFIFFIEISS